MYNSLFYRTGSNDRKHSGKHDINEQFQLLQDMIHLLFFNQIELILIIVNNASLSHVLCTFCLSKQSDHLNQTNPTQHSQLEWWTIIAPCCVHIVPIQIPLSPNHGRSLHAKPPGAVRQQTPSVACHVCLR